MKSDPGRMGTLASPRPSVFSIWPHRLALLLVCATFPLLFIGGLVTSKGAGLAVPDWPTTFGHNMFFYPWSKMVGNIFYEHSHRLVASFVGLLTIAVTVTVWLRESRAWLRWLAAAALALVIVQGVLGGLRVVLLEQTLAIVHAATAQAFFALTVGLAVLTSKEWLGSPEPMKSVHDGGRLRRLCLATTALIYIQVVIGAVLRHTGERVDAHLAFAALVALHTMLILIRVSRNHASVYELQRPALVLFALLLLQLLLGTVSYLAKFTAVLRLPIDATVILTTTHLACGALMLGTAVALTLRSYRLSMARTQAAGREILTEQFST
ncbi:MAG TPA: COX15/CtaA family protein [Candidatus Binatia bacterium]|jgi:cytochrome c oxidase assembly protein subunit 15